MSSEQFVPIWSNILSPDNEQLNFGVIRQDIWYNENVLLPKQLASHVSLAMLNSLTGEELWQWDDFYPIDRGSIIISTSHQCKNLLYFGVNNRLYGIDLTNGQTILKQKIPGFSIRRLSGFGEVLLLSGYEMNVEHGYEVPVVYTLKSQLNAPEKLFEAPQTYEFVNRLNFTGFIGSPKCLFHSH